jgi:hypothetical protein
MNSDIQQQHDALTALRDYLVVTEQNKAAVNGWLDENAAALILYYRRHPKALDNAALPGFDMILLDPLPQLVPMDADILERVEADRRQLKVDEAQPKKSFSVASWFHRDEKRRAEEERRLRCETHALRDEILSLQGERHYYIDSFMDWAADMLTSGAADTVMLQYQSPQQIIVYADADYAAAVETGIENIKAVSLRYAKLATALDRGDASAIAKHVSLAYCAPPTAESRLLHQVLLKDFKAGSLRDILKEKIPSRPRRDFLLEHLRGEVRDGHLCIPNFEKKSLIDQIILQLEHRLLDSPRR